MFGIGGSELLVIALVALLVFGPGRIPEVVRTISSGYRELTKLRRKVDDTVSDLKQDLRFDLGDDLSLEQRQPRVLSNPTGKPPQSNKPAQAQDESTGRGSLDDYLAEKDKGSKDLASAADEPGVEDGD